jgi:hypothetical protein
MLEKFPYGNIQINKTINDIPNIGPGMVVPMLGVMLSLPSMSTECSCHSIVPWPYNKIHLVETSLDEASLSSHLFHSVFIHKTFSFLSFKQQSLLKLKLMY